MLNKKLSLRLVPVFILLTTSVTYGLLIPWQGLYWDDWVFAWLLHSFGPQEFIPAFIPFRPLLGPIFTATTAILGGNPYIWQVMGVATRSLISISAWYAFSIVWPRHKWQVLLVALAMIVFPGYGQQWVALTHVNQEMIPLIFFLLSLGFTARLFEQPHPKWTFPLSLVFACLGLCTTEYFIGLELLRGLVIFFLIPQVRFLPRVWETLKKWGWYLVLWLVNFGWLNWYYRSGAYSSYQLNALDGSISALGSLSLLAIWQEILHTLKIAGLDAWLQVGNPFVPPFKMIELAALGLVLGVFIILVFCLPRLDVTDENHRKNQWAFQAIILGLVGILAGRLPSWAAGLAFSLQFDADRLMISVLVGSSFLLVGVLDLLPRSRKLQIYAMSFILSSSIGFQFLRANDFKNDLILTRRYFWQMAWRIPALKSDTLLLTPHMPMPYESDHQLTAPLNWIYNPDQPSHDIEVALLSLDRRLGGWKLPELKPDLEVRFEYRTAMFTGSTSDMLAVYVPISSCLKVLDPLYFDETDQLTRFIGPLADAISYSDVSRIETNASQPDLPSELFGSEPEHTWCYYYEKADLMRQTGDWTGAKTLLDEASSKNYGPQDPFEWFIVIEAYARTGSVDEAHRISLKLADENPQTISSICKIWKRLSLIADDPLVIDQANNIFPEIGCTP